MIALLAALAVQAKPLPERPAPTAADVAYGSDSERQKCDFRQAKSEAPTPLVLLIHGGGWTQGTKESYGTSSIQADLDAGISVAAINHRFIAQAMEQKVEPPVKAPLHDAARALQTLRSMSKEWNLDPKELREWIPNSIYGGHAFGFAAKGRTRPEEFELLIEHREKVLAWIREYSPIGLLSKDDPPLFLDYPNQKTPPVVGQKESDPTHSAIYGLKLAERAAPLGLECVLSHAAGGKDAKYGSISAFLIAKLQAD